MTFLSASYGELLTKVQNLTTGKENLAKEVSSQLSEITRSTNEINMIKDTLNEHEQYSRRECLEIKGVPMHPAEDTNKIVKDVGKLVGVVIKDEDLSISHRLATDPNKMYPPVIKAKFTRRDVRNKLYSAKKILRNKTRDIGFVRESPQSLFISESLTQRNRKLFNKCLEAKKDLKFKFLWTSNGKILLRKDEHNPAKLISNEKHLKKVIDQHRINTRRDK